MTGDTNCATTTDRYYAASVLSVKQQCIPLNVSDMDAAADDEMIIIKYKPYSMRMVLFLTVNSLLFLFSRWTFWM